MSPSLATRQLHVVWLIDQSGSMNPDGNIQAINTAIRETLPHIRRLADSEPLIDVSMRVLGFADGCGWIVHAPQAVQTLRWVDVPPVERGLSEFGVALNEVNRSLTGREFLTPADPPPVVVVLSDGLWTDTQQPPAHTAIDQFDTGAVSMQSPRIAIAIGRDPDVAELQHFVGTRGEVVKASSPQRFLAQMQGALGTAIQGASRMA